MSTESYKAGILTGAAAELYYKQRCEQLEELCCDLYRTAEEYASDGYEQWKWESYGGDFSYRDRMDALGLLEVENG